MASSISNMRMLGRAIRRPRLVVALAGAGWRFRARRWWARPPFLPVPPSEYMEWRLHTAYGDESQEATVEDLEDYVRWANRMHRTRRAASVTR